MKRTTLATFIISTLLGIPTAHATEHPEGASTITPPLLHNTVSHTGSMTSPLQPSSNPPAPSSQSIAPDCDGKAPATGSVTALLSKFVRSSNTARGVQCPIPPVSDQSTTQETRP